MLARQNTQTSMVVVGDKDVAAVAADGGGLVGPQDGVCAGWEYLHMHLLCCVLESAKVLSHLPSACQSLSKEKMN